jgi:hypothetical protein
MCFGLEEAVYFKWECCELPVDFQWPVNTYLRMVVLEVQGDAV